MGSLTTFSQEEILPIIKPLHSTSSSYILGLYTKVDRTAI